MSPTLDLSHSILVLSRPSETPHFQTHLSNSVLHCWIFLSDDGRMEALVPANRDMVSYNGLSTCSTGMRGRELVPRPSKMRATVSLG